jgi:hypothetical protein
VVLCHFPEYHQSVESAAAAVISPGLAECCSEVQTCIPQRHILYPHRHVTKKEKERSQSFGLPGTDFVRLCHCNLQFCHSCM